MLRCGRGVYWILGTVDVCESYKQNTFAGIGGGGGLPVVWGRVLVVWVDELVVAFGLE